MLVVIDVPDYDDIEGMIRELRAIQKMADETISDPDYDRDEEGEPMGLRTAEGEVEVGVARIVGIASPYVNKTTFDIYPLESL